MGLKVASPSLHWSRPSFPQSPPSSSQTLASAISSPSLRRRSFFAGDGSLFCRLVEKSGLLNRPTNLYRSQSYGNNNRSNVRIIRKSVSASFDSFSNEDFSKTIEELSLKFEQIPDSRPFNAFEPPYFPDRDEDIERKANSVDIPLSLRMIKKKQQWQGGIVEAGETAYCSVKKAFSSMVFIIRELHSYTLQMRSILLCEDLQGILANVQKEIHASFVWLFQTIFSQTPTLMVYVMILLANYSVYSMSTNIVAAPQLQTYASTTTEDVSVVVDDSFSQQKFDSQTSVGGNCGGGGGKSRSVASGTEGDGKFDESNYSDESVSWEASKEEEAALWDSVVEEASQMEGGSKGEGLDQETRETSVSPVDELERLRIVLRYQAGLAQEPNNPLLLANYAQFLYLVVKDLDRAEDYFKRATEVEPKDADALCKYANFLWLARNDLWEAEHNYNEAIDAEPDNPFYSSNYAHFLWNTGGEDTCYPVR